MKVSHILLSSVLLLGFTAGFTACGTDDYEIADPILSPISAESVTGTLQGDDYIITWPKQDNLKMQVALYVNGAKSGAQVVEGNTYTHKDLDTNVPYQYVLKTTDGSNFSSGVIHSYTRLGASRIESISMSQLDKANGYDAKVEWPAAADADKILLTATNGAGRTINTTLDGKATSFLIENVLDEEVWTVTLVAQNASGNSRTTQGSLRIGKTMIGFLSEYPTPEELVANGDDDEASAWLWLHSEYPTAKYVYFGDVKSAADLNSFRVLFWLRDIETGNEADVFTYPASVTNATPAITEWYKNGGSLLLWSHAMPYVEKLGRIPEGTIQANDRAIGTGQGSINNDVWRMAVTLTPGDRFTKDHSTHPIYKGLETSSNGNIKLIAFKGAGWTEDHNCLFFNYPSALTGIGNQEESCYSQLTQTYGIYPLGTWDSQVAWVSQLNVWEAQQGNTEFKGTLLCIGNGGCEFSMKNADGTPDKRAYPKNNAYQENVLTLAKNSLEYLKTR